MRGPRSTTNWTSADRTPKPSGILERFRAMTEPGVSAARHAAPRRSASSSQVTARHPRTSRHSHPHGAAGTERLLGGPGRHAVLFYSGDEFAGQAARRYIALDASETLDRSMVADWPSAASFWQAISPIVTRAAEAGTPVHVFCEMVALLWEAGQVNAAVEVEAMWNELAAQYQFSLLCAYPACSVRGDQHRDALAEVCRVHASAAGEVPDRV